MNIFDLHNDFLNEKRLAKWTKIANECEKEGAKNMCCAVWTTKINKDNVMTELETASRFCKTSKNAIFCVEDLHFITLNKLQEFASLKPFYASFTWKEENVLAGGMDCLSGLSSFGKIVANFLQNQGVFVDIAHLNERSFLDFAKISTRPIICSHGALYRFCESNRNLKDYQIKIIQESEGLFGLFFSSRFVSGKNNAELLDLVKQIEYFCDKFDINNLAVGSGFFGTKHTIKHLKKYKQILNLESELINRGFFKEEIDKILYKNAEQFFNRSAYCASIS